MRFPPAWYPDPTGRHDHRWWDGAEWTAHVADAGVAAIDPLPAAPSPSEGVRTGAAAAPAPGVAVAALVVGIAAALLGWVPFLGLGVAVVGVGLAVLGLRRTTRRGRGRGMAAAGLTAALLGGLTAVATTWFAVLLLADGTGGRLGDAARTYVACLDEAPQDVCERRLTEDLLAAFDRRGA
jgi:hypothetical protein